jgi:hypothetical protein
MPNGTANPFDPKAAKSNSGSEIPTGSLEEMLVRLLFQEKSLRQWCGPEHPELVQVHSRIHIIQDLLAQQKTRSAEIASLFPPDEKAEPFCPLLRVDLHITESGLRPVSCLELMPERPSPPVPFPWFAFPLEAAPDTGFASSLGKDVQEMGGKRELPSRNETASPVPLHGGGIQPTPFQAEEKGSAEEPKPATKTVLAKDQSSAPKAQPHSEDLHRGITEPNAAVPFWQTTGIVYLVAILTAFITGSVVQIACVSFLWRRYREHPASLVRGLPVHPDCLGAENSVELSAEEQGTPQDSLQEGKPVSLDEGTGASETRAEWHARSEESTTRPSGPGPTGEIKNPFRQETTRLPADALLRQIFDDNMNLQKQINRPKGSVRNP